MWKRFLNWLILLALIVGPTAIALHGQQAAATFLMTSLVIVLASLNLPADRLEEFGIGPLKARLERRIKEADELTDRLKEVMRLMLSVAVSAGMRTGRFAHQTQLYHQELYTNVEKIFERTGLDPSAKAEVLRDFLFFLPGRHVPCTAWLLNTHWFGNRAPRQRATTIEGI